MGSLFYACCEEQKDLSFLEALGRLLACALDKVRQAGGVLETAMTALVEALASEAVDILRNKQRFLYDKTEITNSYRKSES